MTKQILILGLDRDARRTLLALYELAAQNTPDRPGGLLRQSVRIDPNALARRLAVSPAHMAHTLRELDGAGMVWGARCRLTMRGLVTAARLSALRALAGARGRAA